jgi:hypothetical protein
MHLLLTDGNVLEFYIMNWSSSLIYECDND